MTTRRTFLGLAAAGVAGAAAAVTALRNGSSRPTGPVADTVSKASAKPRVSGQRRALPENDLPGDPDWELRSLGGEHEIEGYAGRASVLPGESFPLFVSTRARSFRVTAFRMGWYHGDGARKVWQSGSIRGHAQGAAGLIPATRTLAVGWDPALTVPTDDWPAGAYVLRLDADSGAQRYVPLIVRSADTSGKVVLRHAIQTWQAYNTWGGYDLYKGPSGAYSERSLAVSLDRPYDLRGADMFLTYERNAVKLAESLGLPLAYVADSDIAADAHLLDGAVALISLGHDEYWTPAERATVTAARDAGTNLAFLGANAMFRRTRLESASGAATSTGGRSAGDRRLVICYKTDYEQDPLYGKDNAAVTSDWRGAPDPDPESSLIGTIYEGYPVNAAYVVTSPHSWVFAGTGVTTGERFANLVGIEYDRVDPAYPLERPIEVLSHSPLTCNGVASYGDSAYYTHGGGAGVFNCGTMRWVEALYGDQPHGIGGATPAFVRRVTTNILRAFAEGPAAAKYPARDNLASAGEPAGDPNGNSDSLQ
ncbi:MAG TPA: N,N-dimethylformamidase beta subunit family domain-containing protein [Trebonia sp.]